MTPIGDINWCTVLYTTKVRPCWVEWLVMPDFLQLQKIVRRFFRCCSTMECTEANAISNLPPLTILQAINLRSAAAVWASTNHGRERTPAQPVMKPAV